MNPQTQDPNALKIVTFTNKTDFTFTPEMGCMFNGQPIHGITGTPGIGAGETLQMHYYVGKQLAINLAKKAILTTAPRVDQAGAPQGVPLWDDVLIQSLVDSYITELYTESAPKSMSDADRMMAKIEELKKAGYFNSETSAKTEETATPSVQSETYTSKPDVIAELVKRGIKFDARSSKESLEKLLA